MREIKYKAFDKVNGEWLDSDDLIFQGGCWFKNFRALEDYVALPVDEGDVVIVQFVGKVDEKGIELYERDVISDNDELWKIYYCDEMMTWMVEPIGRDVSDEMLTEFLNRKNTNEVMAVKIGSSIEHPHLLEGVN